MKLKYKKIILLTTLCTMGIGLLTLSLTQNNPKAEERENTNSKQEENIQEDALNKNDVATMSAIDDESKVDTDLAATSTPTPSPTPSPTPTPIPVHPLEEADDMEPLFEEFYMAKVAIDLDKHRELYMNPDRVESKETLEKLVQYIEEYKNIKVYAKKGMDEGTFIVYVYHDIKFAGINTLAPGVSKFYVVTNEAGEYKIVDEKDMSSFELDYFLERNEDEDVQLLLQETNTKGEEAKDKDEDLMIFWNGLNNLANQKNNKVDEENLDNQADAEE
ncbi:MAG: hypothetical protein GX321_05110 [Clostridiales bacterium]|nr:hypothetical protein [Clostridiales bacterium]